MTQRERDADRSPVHLVVDLPSLERAARTAAIARGEPRDSLQIHAAQLRQIMAAGRGVESTILVTDQSLPEAGIAPLHRCFDDVLVLDGGAGDFVTPDRLVGDVVSCIVDRATDGSTIVVATAENAGGALGPGLSTSLVAAIQRHIGIELVSFEGSPDGVLGELHRKLGIVVFLDRFIDSVTYLDGGRRAVGPTFHNRLAMDLDPWTAAAQDADDILNRRLLGPFSWRGLRSAPKLDPQALADFRSWLDMVGADGDLDGALDRLGLRVSRRNRLVRHLALLLRSVELADGLV